MLLLSVNFSAGVLATPSQGFPLRRGVNVLGWYSSATAAAMSTQIDYPLVARLGFSFARLPVDPVLLGAGTGQLNNSAVTRLDRVIVALRSLGVASIVDIHPSNEFKRRLLVDRGAGDAFVRFWLALATHLSQLHPAGSVAFELLNEPFEPNQPIIQSWNQLQTRLWKVVRAAAPSQLIILSGAHWSQIAGLNAIDVIHDSNTVYTIHFYFPQTFTFQGANWGSYQTEPIAHLHGVPYPATINGIDSAVASLGAAFAQSVSHVELVRTLRAYEREGTEEAIGNQIDSAASWARRNNVRIFVGEFGVYRRWTPAADRAQWLKDVRSQLEADSIPWAVFALRGGFGLLNADGLADSTIMHALKLSDYN